jgi:hypothetical protein
VTGSFYLVGEAKKHLADLSAKRASAGESGQGSLSATVKRAGLGARERQTL